MTAVARRQARAQVAEAPRPADVLVIFGITGDLAKVMTYRSLYRLERRGLLDCPVVGVAADDWTVNHVRDRARESIVAGGEELDEAVFERLAMRLAYISGDFADAETFERVASAVSGAQAPVFYLEIPPFLFGKVIAGLANAGLTHGARVVVEKPFGHDLGSARQLNDAVHEHLDESQLYRIDHFLG
jgi:glucose-6-phosphate 1-dehydrogenase